MEPRQGARMLSGSVAEFRVWAPRAKTVQLKVFGETDETHWMEPESGGSLALLVPGVTPGTDYAYVLDGERQRPDPVSRWQPHGVHGPSRVVDPSRFRWTDAGWRGLALEEMVFYELHTGTFTPEGTFDGAIAKLPYLKHLGVTAVELMPVAEFPGARNWGYDGVSLYAPHSAYGGPDGLRRFVDACHGLGMAAVLDVVYNHLGPEGNYLGEFGPYFTNRYLTPWGDALNFDGPDCGAVRRFFIDNAAHWLREYHFDALRLDAVHGIFDFGARHVLEEMHDEFQAEARRLGRKAWLIAESDLNDTRIVRPKESGGYGLDAQWMDDFHHSVTTVLNGGGDGYLSDFGRLADVEKTLAEGFVYDGRYSRHRRRRYGNSSAEIPGRQFVVCVQNHDQVANAGRGHRLSVKAGPEKERLAAALLVCAPYLPMLFMGQEYGETAPFHYFTSHGDTALADAVREGRRREFAAFVSAEEFADPQAEETFLASKLDWSKPGEGPGAGLLHLYRTLFALRREHASLRNCRKDLTRVEANEERRWLVMERGDDSDDRTLLVCNLSGEAQTAAVECGGRAWTLLISTADQRFGGTERAPEARACGCGVKLGPWEAALYATSG